MRASTLIVVCGVAWLLPSDVGAGLKIRISDGVSTTVVGDNSSGDLDFSKYGERRDGVLYVSHAFGWGDISFTAGVSKPEIGGFNNPMMQLSALRLTSWANHQANVTIELTDTDFTGAPGGLDPATFASQISGFTTGSITYGAFADLQNREFGTGSGLGQYSHDSDGSGLSFGSNWNGHAGLAPPFSLTMRAVVTHMSAGITRFDSDLKAMSSLHAVPEPASLLGWACLLPFALIVAKKWKIKKI